MSTPSLSESTPDVGTSLADVETPALVVDLDVMERNLEEYAAFADEHGVRLRSHAKTHKIPALAHRQHERTGGGILCQTLGEAAVMAHHGVDDIYLSYMVVEPSKLDRLVALAERLDDFATTVDSRDNLRPVQEAAARRDATVDVVLELDIGLERVGVSPGPDAVELAADIAERSNVRLAGVMAYEGHLGYGDDPPTTAEAYESACFAAMDDVAEAVEAIEAEGVAVPEVKVGSTATSRYSGKHPVVDEINPGMYLFNDARLVDVAPHVEAEDCALTVLSTVMSAPTADRAVADAGSKSISMDVDREPMAKGTDGVRYYNASEEHGWLDASGADQQVDVGDKLQFVPPHVCTTVNLHDVLVGVRDGVVEETWDVAARGKVQ